MGCHPVLRCPSSSGLSLSFKDNYAVLSALNIVKLKGTSSYSSSAWSFSLINMSETVENDLFLLTLPSRAASAAWLLPSALISCWPVRESILEISVRADNEICFWLLPSKQNSQSEKYWLRADNSLKKISGTHDRMWHIYVPKGLIMPKLSLATTLIT